MRVLFDYQAFQAQRIGGVSKSFCEILRHLPGHVKWEIGISQSDNVYLQELLPDIEPVRFSYGKGFFRGKDRMLTLLDRLGLIRTAESLNKEAALKALGKGDFDVFHPTYFDPYFLQRLRDKPFVLTIHDLIPERFPEYFSRNDIQIRGRKALIEHADAIVAVSENTKKDIMEIYGVPAERISVAYHGGPEPRATDSATSPHKPYFLFVGSRGKYKNFSALLKGFSEFCEKNRDVDLICTGHPFSADESSDFARLGLEHRILHRNASEEEMVKLYNGAIALVYPSRYEGFGMPVLEAFAYHCPVLLGTGSSLPEVGGDVAIYLDPSFDDMAEKLEYFTSMSRAERDRLIKKGLCRLKEFSWEKAAEKYTEIYSAITR